MSKSANKKQRDTVFRLLFRQNKELLSLYNAVAGTNYTDENELEIKTLENAIFMAKKNDLAFLFRTDLQLYEQQSSVNPNMPLRFLQYFSELLERDYVTTKIYNKKRVMIPAPTFITFYNGSEAQPERLEQLLSDSFETIERVNQESGEKILQKPINVEIKVIQLNINPGFNEKLKEECPSLKGYIQYWNRIMYYRKEEKLSLNEAVAKAVDECIREGILTDFLNRNKSEVTKMSIFEFNQEEYEKSVRDESREEGRKEGREEGRKEGVQDINALNRWLFEQGRTEDVQKATTDEEFQKALFAEMELALKGSIG